MPDIKTDFDVVIIGGGPGGTVLGTYLAQNGVSVAIVEKQEFPRFQVGESLLPYSMEVFKEIGFYDYLLESGKYIKKLGAEFVDGQINESIRFDFTLGGTAVCPFAFEVERDEFDLDLLNHAKDNGVHIFQPEKMTEVTEFRDHLKVQTNYRTFTAKYLADASGRSSFLSRKLGNRETQNDFNNVGIFAHYEDVLRKEGDLEGDITIGLLENNSWSWIIPFKGRKSSVGVVVSSNEFTKFKDEDDIILSLMNNNSNLKQMMSAAKRTTGVRIEANYSQKSLEFFGDRWILIGDAAQFLDPIFSSGVHISINSAKFASDCLFRALKDDSLLSENNLGNLYVKKMNVGLTRFHKLLNLFYSSDFVTQMNKVFHSDRMRESFTKALAGGVWEESNPLFRLEVL